MSSGSVLDSQAIGGGFRSHSLAECFSSLVFSRVAGLESHRARWAVVKMCLRAWNMGCETKEDGFRRVHQDVIQQASRLNGPARTAFLSELGALTKVKRELFPWLTQTIDDADLADESSIPRLVLTIRGKSTSLPMAINPTIETLPGIEVTLESLIATTEAMAPLLLGIELSRGTAISDIDLTKLASVYAVQKANLSGYRAMLLRMARLQLPEKSRCSIERSLENIQRIDTATDTVLDLLLSSMKSMESMIG